MKQKEKLGQQDQSSLTFAFPLWETLNISSLPLEL